MGSTNCGGHLRYSSIS